MQRTLVLSALPLLSVTRMSPAYRLRGTIGIAFALSGGGDSNSSAFGTTQNHWIYVWAAAESINGLVVAKYKMHRQGIGRKCLAKIPRILWVFHDCV